MNLKKTRPSDKTQPPVYVLTASELWFTGHWEEEEAEKDWGRVFKRNIIDSLAEENLEEEANDLFLGRKHFGAKRRAEGRRNGSGGHSNRRPPGYEPDELPDCSTLHAV